MVDKFNAFAKAQEETKNRPKLTTTLPPKKIKTNKLQVTIMLEPNQKARGQKLAEESGMSLSELLGYLIDNAQ